MQVGVLGSIHTMVTKSREHSEPTAGFASILDGLTLQEENQNEGLGEKQQNQELSKTDIAQLIDFLNILGSLNESDDLANLELSKFIEEFPEMEEKDALQGFITILPYIDLEQIQLPAEKDPTQLQKSLKLVGFLSQDEGTIAKIQEFLQKASKQLDPLISPNKFASRMDILSKVVSPLVKELNGQQIATGQKKQVVMLNNSFVSADTSSRNEVSNLKQGSELMNGSTMPIQQITRPEQLTLMVNSSGKLASVEELIQQFQSILSKSQFGTTGGAQKLFIKLNPENLGALRIEMVLKDSTLIAKIQTTTSIAKDVLESQLQNLKNAFHSQNIVVDKIEISQQLSQQERFFHRDSQEQREQNQDRQQEQDQQSEQSQEDSFREALLNVEV